jgi:hypothetical protein
MATNRVPIRRLSKGRITPEAINAWKRCDSDALHLALGLAPWEQSPLPEEVTSLGVSEDNPPDPKNIGAWDSSYDKAIKLQRKLVATVGWPDCRAAYERGERMGRLLRQASEAPRTRWPRHRL